jgi:hypothetical protein
MSGNARAFLRSALAVPAECGGEWKVVGEGGVDSIQWVCKCGAMRPKGCGKKTKKSVEGSGKSSRGEVTGFWLDEAAEIDVAALDALGKKLGKSIRYGGGAGGGKKALVDITKALQESARDIYCPWCKSWHPQPMDRAHKRALQCSAPDGDLRLVSERELAVALKAADCCGSWMYSKADPYVNPTWECACGKKHPADCQRLNDYLAAQKTGEGQMPDTETDVGGGVPDRSNVTVGNERPSSLGDSGSSPSISSEQIARDILERMGVEKAQEFTDGNLVGITSLLDENKELSDTLMAVIAVAEKRGWREQADQLAAYVEERFTLGEQGTVKIASLTDEVESFVKFVRVLGEECVIAGLPAGDRDVILANIRALLSVSGWGKTVEPRYFTENVSDESLGEIEQEECWDNEQNGTTARFRRLFNEIDRWRRNATANYPDALRWRNLHANVPMDKISAAVHADATPEPNAVAVASINTVMEEIRFKSLNTTRCWKCKADYPMKDAKCSQCGASNANVDLDAAQADGFAPQIKWVGAQINDKDGKPICRVEIHDPPRPGDILITPEDGSVTLKLPACCYCDQEIRNDQPFLWLPSGTRAAHKDCSDKVKAEKHECYLKHMGVPEQPCWGKVTKAWNETGDDATSYWHCEGHYIDFGYIPEKKP